MKAVKRSDPKDRHKKDLRSLDSSEQAYWDEILRREGLSMSAGSDRRLIYTDLDLSRVPETDVEEWVYGGHKVRPKGAKPE